MKEITIKLYDTECLYARLLAKGTPAHELCPVLAEAVVECKAHPICCLEDNIISFEYDNSFGPTVGVDGFLEFLSMRDWRTVCNSFLTLLLKKGGLDPNDFNWPAPIPHVTKVPEEEGTDVISRVHVTVKVDPKTYDAVLRIVNKEGAMATEEEICSHCDAVIRYVPKKGKRVVTCPECGAANPLCNECEPDTKSCANCKVSKLCEKLNGLQRLQKGEVKDNE